MKKGKRAGESPFGVDVLQGKSYFWCTCGESLKQPFCDGSHKETDFTPLQFVIYSTGEKTFYTNFNRDDELDYFYSRYRDEISGCGYNDHMLFKAWEICFLDSYPRERKSMKFYRNKFNDEIRNRLTKKNNKFIDDLKEKILNS